MSMVISMQGRQGFISHTTTSFVKINLSKREAVREFSVKSAGRIRRYLRTCTANYSLLGTLTYPEEYPKDGRVVKQHLRAFIKRYRRKVQETYSQDEYAGFSIFWFLEFQSRGAPHFHFFTTHLPASAKDAEDYRTACNVNKGRMPEPGAAITMAARRWIANSWYQIVGSGDPKHKLAGTQLDWLKTGRGGTIKYATKYALKQKQKKVPEGYENVGRFWGVSGFRSCMSATLVVTNRVLKDKETKFHIEWMYSWLEAYERAGYLKLHKDYHGGIKGFYCPTDYGAKKTWAKINQFIQKLIVLTEKDMYTTYDDDPYDIEWDWQDGS